MMSSDLISREALKKALHNFFDGKVIDEPVYILRDVFYHIDNAPTVKAFTEEDIAGAYNEGYMCGNREAEKGRPQGEYVDISKLRLMTVEECAGHTIEYAMGWKACIDWLKKGGAV